MLTNKDVFITKIPDNLFTSVSTFNSPYPYLQNTTGLNIGTLRGVPVFPTDVIASASSTKKAYLINTNALKLQTLVPDRFVNETDNLQLTIDMIDDMLEKLRLDASWSKFVKLK